MGVSPCVSRSRDPQLKRELRRQVPSTRAHSVAFLVLGVLRYAVVVCLQRTISDVAGRQIGWGEDGRRGYTLSSHRWPWGPCATNREYPLCIEDSLDSCLNLSLPAIGVAPDNFCSFFPRCTFLEYDEVVEYDEL